MFRSLQTEAHLASEAEEPSGYIGSEGPCLQVGASEPGSSLLNSGILDRFAIPTVPQCHLVARSEPLSIGAEQFQTLASRLKYCQSRRGVKKLLVTSAVPGEGKTLVAANLAITLAQHRQRVLIIDGDLRHPGLGKLLQLENHRGLGDWWVLKTSIWQNMYREETLPLWILPAGKAQDWPLRILQSGELQEVLVSLRVEFDWILIDSPPMMPFADAAAWSALSDAILLVTRQRVTPTKLLRKALKSIDNSKIIATILNEANIIQHRYYHRYYTRVAQQLPVVPPPGSSRLLDMKRK